MKTVRLASEPDEQSQEETPAESSQHGASNSSFDSLPGDDSSNERFNTDNTADVMNTSIPDSFLLSPSEVEEMVRDPRRRTASEDFHRWMKRHEAVAPTSTRRSELPTYYRAFYTGLWYKDIRTHCYPHGWNVQYWPLLLSFLAEVFTIWGSFSCQYFRGASIEFTGNRYGIWTLEDIHGKCQLWSVIFYAYDLGGPLRWSRVFSMSAMVLGLAVLTTMAQAMQCHAISWGVGLILFIVFLVSVSTTSTFNIWIVWALFNYILFVLLVRAAFVHPVARRISRRGCCIIAGCQVACHVFAILTLVVLKSDFCTCDSLSPGRLAGRITEDSDPCENVCALHVSGYMVIFASALWLLGSLATLRVGIQPQLLYVARPPEMYVHYSRESITARVAAQLKSLQQGFTSPMGRAKRSSNGNSKSSVADVSDESAAVARQSMVDGTDGASTDGADNFTATDEKIASSTRTDSREDGELDMKSPSVATRSDDVVDSEGDDDDDDDTDWPPKRSCCQKCCCDFRVTPRSRNEKLFFWSFRFTLGFIIALYTILVILMIGSRAENLNAQEAPDTSPYFITDVVCAYDPEDASAPFRTFASKQDALDEGWIVAHCGACGFCSNMPDIKTYVDTRKTIAASAKKCGPVNFLGTFDALVDCIQDRIPFSDDCAVCWAENMRNTGRDCLFTCLATLFTGFMAHNNVDGAGSAGWLNHCLYCDEKLSGPAFVTCSGVSRRRLGIVSEIERNPAEQCRNVDIDWVNVDITKL